MLRGGIEKYEARIVDLQRSVTVLETSRKVTFANIVGVVKKDKPLEPADDNSDPKDPEEATGLNDAVCFDILLILLFCYSFLNQFY